MNLNQGEGGAKNHRGGGGGRITAVSGRVSVALIMLKKIT